MFWAVSLSTMKLIPHSLTAALSRPGIRSLVKVSNPVGPIAYPVLSLIGTDAVQPKGRTIPRVRRVGVVFGEPIDVSHHADGEADRHALRSATDEIMYEIMRLSGQEYVDTYTVSQRPRLLTETEPAGESSGT